MAAGCFVIQKASSALISNMITLTFIFLLWFVAEPALCFPVTAGVNGTVQMFYCEGCAPYVTKVFCNDVNLLDHSNISDCSGPPELNSVCKQNGLVFVSTNPSGNCEFEGENHIETKKCSDLNICSFPDPRSSSSSTVSPATKDDTKALVIGLVVSVVLLVVAVVLVAYYCRKRRMEQLNLGQQRAPGETKALKMDEKSGNIIERELDDDTSPSHCDSGV